MDSKGPGGGDGKHAGCGGSLTQLSG
jgi:hypothetical protein